MSQTEFLEQTVNLDRKGGARRGQRVLVLIAPYDATGTVGANVVKTYHRASDAETDHGAGSVIAEGVEAALRSGPRKVIAVGLSAKSGSPFTDTKGNLQAIDDSGDAGSSGGVLTAANMPIRTVTAASRDGTNILAGVKFTSKDPTTLAPAANEVYINPDTGAWKLGTSTSGSGAGFVVTYTSDDWQKAFDALEGRDFEYITIPGYTFTKENFGLWKELLTYASDTNHLVAAGLASAVTPASVASTDFAVTDIGTQDRLALLAAKYTGDLTSAWAGNLTAGRIAGTRKMQQAPQGVVYTGGYVRADFGDEESPDTGTFHNMGVNAVYENEFGDFEVSNDRARTPLSDFGRFLSTRRITRYVMVNVEGDLVAARRESDDAIPMTDAGMEILRGLIEGALSRMANERVIDPKGTNVEVPLRSDLLDADVANRIVSGVEYSFLAAGQLHMVKATVNVATA